MRLLVASSEGIEHASFRYLGRFLHPGDLVVINTSATIPAALDASRGRKPVVVHFSAPMEDGTWTVELRERDGAGPLFDARSGERLDLAGGGALEVVGPYSGIEGRSRILTAKVAVAGSVEGHLSRHGRPIAYSYLNDRWPLSMYQTVFAKDPGSAEMPSAGRPFTTQLVTDLIAGGVSFAPITLHAGVSSLERDETPLPERVKVPAATAKLVAHTRSQGGRVIAAGTTVARALESASNSRGQISAYRGWTDLILSPDRPARVVDGLITGWHPPEASHQLLLEAVAENEVIDSAYDSALRNGYLWHEFGDSCLLLP